MFDLAAQMIDPINLSIGQPDFDVPEAVQDAAIEAIRRGVNRYTVTQGLAELREKIGSALREEFPNWSGLREPPSSPQASGVLVTSGVSGALVLALLACVGPGDEVLFADPYFVMYKHLTTLAGATPVCIDTYPDFQFTADRIKPHITDRTKLLLFNSPSNPTGVVASEQTCREVVELAQRHNLLIVSDEIYDTFCYETMERPAGSGLQRCPSPAAFTDNLLLLRGFSKTYGMTGWRLGYAAGPKAIVEQMTKLQQFTFVCAPSMVQAAGLKAMEVDMNRHVESYRRKRDRVVERLAEVYELSPPGGAFYVFPKVPEHLELTGNQFVEKAIQRGLLIIPGSVFSDRDTHFRLSYACDDAVLDRGLDLLMEMAS